MRRSVLLGCILALLGAASASKDFIHCPGKGCTALDSPPVDAGADGLQTKIMNGFTAGRWTMYPYMAALVSTPNLQTGAAYCSAVLINNQWLLTAAKCVTDGNANTNNYYMPGRVLLQLLTTVPPPDGDAGKTTYVMTTSDLYWPSTFRAGLDMNVALIKLAEKVTGTVSIAKLAAIGTAAGLADGLSLGIAGFGVTQWNFGDLRAYNALADSNTLRVGAVAYVKSGATASAIRAGNVPTRNTMCAGDWGGPLLKWSPSVQAHQIIGLFISGNPCNPLGMDIPIGYYTDVTYKSVRDWVNKILVSQGQTPV